MADKKLETYFKEYRAELKADREEQRKTNREIFSKLNDIFKRLFVSNGKKAMCTMLEDHESRLQAVDEFKIKLRLEILKLFEELMARMKKEIDLKIEKEIGELNEQAENKKPGEKLKRGGRLMKEVGFFFKNAWQTLAIVGGSLAVAWFALHKFILQFLVQWNEILDLIAKLPKH